MAVLDHLVPVFGRSSNLQPLAPPDPMIPPNVPNASNENPILRVVFGATEYIMFGVAVYAAYRVSTRRSSKGE